MAANVSPKRRQESKSQSDNYLTTLLAIWHDENGEPKSVSIEQYNEFIKDENREKLSEFIYRRLHSRYLKPFQFDCKKYEEEYRNGFSIMANCCLLIETLQSFKNGWEDTIGKKERPFKQFFRDEIDKGRFKDFKISNSNQTYGKAFYENVRCGILHQGETKGRWKINHSLPVLFDKNNLTIDSIKFSEELEKSLRHYSESLRNDNDWNGLIWKHFIDKMQFVINNCKSSNK